ncbi:MAG: hypothetical protein V4686_01010 [Patescibacteria group bacterium]
MNKQIAQVIFQLIDPKMVDKEQQFESFMKIVKGIMVFIGLFAIFLIWGCGLSPVANVAILFGSCLTARLAYHLGLLYFSSEERDSIKQWKKIQHRFVRLDHFHRLYNTLKEHASVSEKNIDLIFLKKHYQDRIRNRESVLHGPSEYTMPGMSIIHR